MCLKNTHISVDFLHRYISDISSHNKPKLCEKLSQVYVCSRYTQIIASRLVRRIFVRKKIRFQKRGCVLPLFCFPPYWLTYSTGIFNVWQTTLNVSISSFPSSFLSRILFKRVWEIPIFLAACSRFCVAAISFALSALILSSKTNNKNPGTRPGL